MDFNYLFVFDVESLGLYGCGYSVGGVVVDKTGKIYEEFKFSAPKEAAPEGSPEDMEWVEKNIPFLPPNVTNISHIRDSFWKKWIECKTKYSGLIMAADCNYPVEAQFLIDCVKQDESARKWNGPYPFVDIGSVLLAAGVDPLQTFDRLPDEFPIHDPLADAKQSARILVDILKKLGIN